MAMALSTQPCACGCGQLTHLAETTQPQWGWVRGQPMRCVRGHFSRLTPATVTYKQQATGTHGYRVHHRMRAAIALGKPLPPGAEVHHVDGDKGSPTARLVICQNRAYHQLLHVRTRIVKAGGNPNTDKICSKCQALKPHAAFPRCRRQPDGLMWYCKPCAAAREDQRRKAKHGVSS